MTHDRKLMRNGNVSLNSTLLNLLDVNPEIHMVRYIVENETLKITKSDILIKDRNKDEL